MTIIGLSGYAGCGKDRAYKYIREFDPEAERFAFADQLKSEVANGWGCTSDYIDENKDRYFRVILQQWGQLRRELDGEDYWIKKVDWEINWSRPEVAVITDVRHLNEVEYVRSKGGVMVRISRPGIEAVNGHISESALDGVRCDYHILNDGTTADLREKVKAMLIDLAGIRENG